TATGAAPTGAMAAGIAPTATVDGSAVLEVLVPHDAEPRRIARRLQWLIWGAEGAGTALLVLGALSAAALALGSGSPLAGWSQSTRLLVTGVLVGTWVAPLVVLPQGPPPGPHLHSAG